MKKIIRLLFFNAVILIAIWLLLELIFGTLLFFGKKEESVIIKGFDSASLLVDNYIGYRCLPNKKIEALKMKDSDTLYHVFYSIDSLGYRANTNNNKSKRNMALFFGCSCTFGEGVKNEQTTPYFFSSLDSSFNTFNFALGGYGTQQMTAILEKGNLPAPYDSSIVFAVYFYLDGHVQRNIGSMNVVNAWGAPSPYYVLESNTAKHKGLFVTHRKWTNFVYRIMGKSRVLRYFNVDIPFEQSEEGLRLTAALIEVAYKNYYNRYRNTNFFVVNFPGSSAEVFNYIGNRQIHKLNYSTLVDLQKHSIPKEGHPDGYCYKTIAEQLFRDTKGIQ